MEDNLLEELLAEIDDLSINHDWSDVVKDPKKNDEDPVLGIIWSDDETVTNDDTPEHDNHDRLDISRTAERCFEKRSVVSSSFDQEKENPSHHSLSLSTHVTLRRKARKKPFISECPESTNEKDTVLDVPRMLSFSECSDVPENDAAIQQCCDSRHEAHPYLNEDIMNCANDRESEESVPCSSASSYLGKYQCVTDNTNLRSTSNFSNDNTKDNSVTGLLEQTNEPKVDKTFEIRTKQHLSNDIYSELPSEFANENGKDQCSTGLGAEKDKSGVEKVNCVIDLSVNNVSTNEKWDKLSEEKTEISENFDGINIQEISPDTCSGENAKKYLEMISEKKKVEPSSNGTDNGYDFVLESESKLVCNLPDSNLEEDDGDKNPILQSKKRTDALTLPHGDEKNGGVNSDNIVPNLTASRQHCVSAKESDYTSSDDDFEAFLTEMKTPKPNKSPKCTQSLEKFIVDDWIVSSDEDELPPLLRRIASDFRTPKRKETSRSTPSSRKIVHTLTISSDDEDPPSLGNIQSTNCDKKNSGAKRIDTSKHNRMPLREATSENTPSASSIKRIVTPYLSTPRKFWRKSRDQLVEELFQCYNQTVFDNKLPVDMSIIWNKQMTKTAGFCYYIGSHMGKKCRIELSDKVVDSCERIRDTLIHELCHAATWLIDDIKAGHGPHWKRWALKARTIHSDLPPISRCHSYQINYKFNYKCLKCHHRYGRHSKSINLETARCPYCFSRLELLPRMNKDGTPAKQRAPSKFSLFVKEHYRKIKENESGLSHQEIMKKLSKRFAGQTNTCTETCVAVL